MHLKHTTMEGTVLTATLTDEERAYIAQLRAKVDDPRVSEAAMINAVYSKDNPIMDRDLLPGRGSVTPEVAAREAYRVCLDLLARKGAALGTIDPEALAAEYSLTVPEAAELLGVTEDGVRKAITDGRLAARKRGGTWFLRPASVEGYRVGNRGPRAATIPALRARIRTERGGSLRVWCPGLEMEADRSGARCGSLEAFEGAGVIWGPKGALRFAELAPSERYAVIRWGGSWVAGRFRVAREVVGQGPASEAWREFKEVSHE